MKRETSAFPIWLGWLLHLLCGAVAGAALGLARWYGGGKGFAVFGAVAGFAAGLRYGPAMVGEIVWFFPYSGRR